MFGNRMGFSPEFACSDGRVLPLAFVYEGRAFYFDVDGFDDSETTAMVASDGSSTEGAAANEALVASIDRYSKHRGRVYIARFFADCVANEVERLQEERG